MNTSNYFLQSIYNGDNFLFSLCSKFEENSLELILFENTTAWKILLSNDELKSKTSEDFKQYYANLRKYLKSHLENVKFKFINGKFTVHVASQTDLNENILKLLDTFYKEREETSAELYRIKEINTHLQNENLKLSTKLDEFITRKHLEEKELFNKFIEIINEKKYQIQHLNDVIFAMKRNSTNKPSQVTKKQVESKKTISKKPKSTRRRITSSSSSSSSVNTLSDATTNDCDTNINFQKESKQQTETPDASTEDIELLNSPTDFLLPFDTSPPPSKKTCSDEDIASNSTPGDKQSNISDEDDSIKKSPPKNCSPTVNFNTQDLLDYL